MKNTIKLTLAASAVALLAACGGGGGGGASVENNSPSFTISGNISGLITGNSVTLKNGSDQITVVSNNIFTFNSPVTSSYAVSVFAQPYWQSCIVENGTGTATANVNNIVVNCKNADAVVSTLAGLPGSSGSTDATGEEARFSTPSGVDVDVNGNIFVADRRNHTIRKISNTGVVTTIAGLADFSDSLDGTGIASRFRNPHDIAVDKLGNVYVADFGNHTIRKITAAGVVTTIAGTAGISGSTDGMAINSKFKNPRGVAVDSSGNVYVADYGNSTIRKITTSGEVSTLAGTAGSVGSIDATGSDASFYIAGGIDVDLNGNVFVADYGNYTVRKITPAGVVTTIAGTAGISGSNDGVGVAANFRTPIDIAVDSIGNTYVVDFLDHTIRKISSAGVVTTIAGTAGLSGPNNGIGNLAKFSSPTGIAVDTAGTIYVADFVNHSIRKITPTP